MNQLAPLLTLDTILLDLVFDNKQALFEHAGNVLSRQHSLKAAEVISSLCDRERLGSTALGYGIAMPHGRIKGLTQPTGVLYRLLTPLEFDAPDHQPVTLCFILLVPKEANDEHLQILGELAQLFGDAAMRQRMLQAPNTAEFHALITAWVA